MGVHDIRGGEVEDLNFYDFLKYVHPACVGCYRHPRPPQLCYWHGVFDPTVYCIYRALALLIDISCAVRTGCCYFVRSICCLSAASCVF